MANVVLYIHTEFRKCEPRILRNEDGIIAEAMRATLLAGNLAIDDALEESALAFLY